MKNNRERMGIHCVGGGFEEGEITFLYIKICTAIDEASYRTYLYDKYQGGWCAVKCWGKGARHVVWHID